MTSFPSNDIRILITNDDGYSADGIKILEEISKSFTDDVWIVAPEYEKSGASHALSFTKELALKSQGEKIFSINGTPSDCVAIALDTVLKDKRPNFILSGVNSGCNIGEDVTYSGTIAAAMEGIIRKVPSISISQNYEQGKKNQINWECTNHYLKKILENSFKYGWNEDVFLNINFPHCSIDEVAGTRITTQGNRETDDLIIYEKEKGIFQFGLQRRVEQNGKQKGVTVNKEIPGYMTDVKAIANKFISITPLHMDLTHIDSLNALKLSFNE